MSTMYVIIEAAAIYLNPKIFRNICDADTSHIVYYGEGSLNTDEGRIKMGDEQIVNLYWVRAENAISETSRKYGKYCHYIAYSILHNDEDSEECVNDTYLRAWDIIPPRRPNKLSTFLGKITRNFALDRYRYNTREKRCGSQIPLVIDELAECIPASDADNHIVDDMVLVDCFNRFLAALPVKTRKIFMRRYWYFSSIKEIAADFSISESNVKMTLLRARSKLERLLEKEGIEL